ncbi:MAG: 4-hydroxybenzoate 3-monooxygenase [Rhodobacter sp.]|jgi:p-hydroxybenzoate 3-monooxygenase|nr:4-hydroxybenzoate 3-monooxygenase [Rhodobacter sp.]
MRTQVAIIGAGPSGLLLSQLLNRAGIATVVLERQSRDHVLSRIRAGVLEWGTTELLRAAGVGERMDSEGKPHDHIHFAVNKHLFKVDCHALTGRRLMVYGQTEVTTDLYAAQDAMGATIIHDAADVVLHDVTSDQPRVTWVKDGQSHELTCDFIAGCDGFHGVSRRTIPADRRREFEKVYPFGWLGILSRTPHVPQHMVYVASEEGFALCSMRNPMLSRHYVQVPLTDRVEDWSDDRFWEALASRLPDEVLSGLVTGPSIEKSIAPLRSFVSEPMRWGRLFLCGDAAHIVPPTGAKGLNLAVGDVFYLQEALAAHYATGDTAGIDGYSARALDRVWKAMRFSWQLTMMMHRFPQDTPYDRRMQDAEMSMLLGSPAVQKAWSETYLGLPY